MHFRSTHAAGGSRKTGATRLALAAMLASGMAIGAAALPASAFAKDTKPPAAAPGKPANSKAFAAVYSPVATIVNTPGADLAAARAQLPAVTAAIQTEGDRYDAGQMILIMGNKLKDRALQRQGLELMLQSGQVEPAKLGQFNYFVGGLAYEDKDYAAARTALQKAIDAGYTDNDPQGMVADTYFQTGQVAEGIKYYQDQIAKRKAAGQPAPEAWLKRSLKAAYDAKLQPQTNDLSAMLVERYPTPDNWQAALEVVNALNQLDSDGRLDIYRLMRQTGALKDKRDYVGYVDAADPQRLSNEVLPVLDEGVKAGVLTASDPFYSQSKSIAAGRAASHKAALAGVAADAQKAADGKIALSAGEQYFSLGEYDHAAQMYQLALDKGTPDRGLALLHLGVAQAEQGQLATARTTFQQVTGVPASVAKMWLAYIDTKQAA